MRKIDRILLIGFRGSGKTEVGRLLAKKLKMDFIDADEEIEKQIGMSISELVAKKGWDEFRKIEKKFLKQILEKKGVVIALGGGAVLHKKEMQELKKQSLIIWLYADIDEIIRRLKKDEKTSTQRPSLTGKPLEEEVKRVFLERKPLYEASFHIKIDTTRLCVSEVVEELYKDIC